MPASAAFSLSLLELLLANTAIANVGNTAGLAGSSGGGSPGSLYLALHTASPGDGAQNVNEAAYPGYARVAIARGSGPWTFTAGNSVTGVPSSAVNAAQIAFAAETTSSYTETETYASVGVAMSGATQVLIYFPLNTSLAVSQGVAPTFLPGQLTLTGD